MKLESLTLVLSVTAAALAPGTAAAQIGLADTPLPLGPAQELVWSVVAHPTDAMEVLASRKVDLIYPGSNLLRSLDGGATFVPQADGPNGVRDLLRDPLHPEWLWARSYDWVNFTMGIAHSIDFGRTWTQVGEPGLYYQGLRVAPDGSSVIGWGAGFLRRTTDGGASWQAIPSATPITGLVEDLQYAPGDGQRVYAFARYGTQPSLYRLYRSSDGGDTFDEVWDWNEGAGIDRFLAVDPSQPDTLVLGDRQTGRMWRSLDGGVNFTQLSTPFQTPWAAEWEPSGAYLWTFANTLAWYSEDSGASWNELDLCAGGAVQYVGFGQDSDRRLSIDPNGRRYYPASSCGDLVALPPGPPLAFEGVGIAGLDIGHVLLTEPGGTRLTVPEFGVVHSAEPGESFAKHLGAAGQLDASAGLSVDPSDPTRWLASRNYTPPFTCDLSGCIYYLETWIAADDGASFVQAAEAQAFVANQPNAAEIVFDPEDAAHAVRVVRGGGWVRASYSGDAGASWSSAAIPGDHLGLLPGPRGCVAFDPHVPGRVLVVGDLAPDHPLAPQLGYVESLDGGLSYGAAVALWPLSEQVTSSSSARGLAFDPITGGVLYVGDTEGGLRRSTDFGATWEPLGVELGPQSRILVHPELLGQLWVSDANGALLVSGDFGASFELASDALDGLRASTLALDVADGALLFGTWEDSVWELEAAAPHVVHGVGTPGTGGVVPRHFALGGLPRLGNSSFELAGDRTVGAALVLPALGFGEFAFPVFGGTWFVDLFTQPWVLLPTVQASGAPGVPGGGWFHLPLPLPAAPNLAGARIWTQCAVLDPGAADPSGLSLTDALETSLLP